MRSWTKHDRLQEDGGGAIDDDDVDVDVDVVVVVVVDDVGRRISWLFQLLLPQQESIVAQVE